MAKARRGYIRDVELKVTEKRCPDCGEVKPLMGGWHTKIVNGKRTNKKSNCIDCWKLNRELEGPPVGAVEVEASDKSLVCLTCPLETCTEDNYDNEHGVCNLQPALRMKRL